MSQMDRVHIFNMFESSPHLCDAHPHLPADRASPLQHLSSALQEARSTAQKACGHELQHLLQSGSLYILTHHCEKNTFKKKNVIKNRSSELL